MSSQEDHDFNIEEDNDSEDDKFEENLEKQYAVNDYLKIYY